MPFRKHYDPAELREIRFRSHRDTSLDRTFLIRPEEAWGVIFFTLLVAMSLGHGMPIFEPIRSSRLTYLTSVVFVGLVLLLVCWTLVRRFGPGMTRSASGGGWRSVFRVTRDWMPAIICLGIYESLKHLHLNEIILWLGRQPLDQQMIRIDEVLFGGHASVWLQRTVSPAMTWYMETVYYYGYYLYPAIAGVFLYLLRPRAAFRELVLAFLACAFIGYATYIVVPVAGPRFELLHLYEHTFVPSSKLMRMMEQHRFQYDCFPSLHTAMPLVVLGVSWRHSRTLALGLAPFVFSTVLSTLYLQMHYLIDVIAGIVLTPIAIWIGIRADRWWARIHGLLETQREGSAHTPRLTAQVLRVLIILVAITWVTSLVV